VASDAVPPGIGKNTTERSAFIVALSAAMVLFRATMASRCKATHTRAARAATGAAPWAGRGRGSGVHVCASQCACGPYPRGPRNLNAISEPTASGGAGTFTMQRASTK